MLKIEHLTKQFGDFKAVDDLSLEVKSGQICAFIGHNGAGKTTTLKSIAGIIPFESGEIYVDGESIMLKKYQPACVFCGSSDDIKQVKGKNVCAACIKELVEL